MAVIRKRGKTWQAIVRRAGVPTMTATRATKREAEEWAKMVEGDIIAGRVSRYPRKTVLDAVTKYRAEVSAHKRSKRFEWIKLDAFVAGFPELAAKLMQDVTPADLGAWRDARLKTVSRGTVQREMNLLKHLWTVAATEWQWCAPDAWKTVRAPGDNPPRSGRWSWRQIRDLLRRLHYKTGQPPGLQTEQVAYIFLLALHTAMRHGEIVRLTREDVDLERRVVTIRSHKTVEAVGTRRIPITKRAARVFRCLCTGTGPLFTVKPTMAEALFRKYRQQRLIEGLTFHDTRATALTWMARKVDPLTLARISGHQDLSVLMRHYYREAPEDIAKRL